MYVKIKLYTKFAAKILIRLEVMIDLKKMANFLINAITQKLLIGSRRFLFFEIREKACTLNICKQKTKCSL